nr:glycosyltransferase family A protein [uncultured Draconibacterium sp.]
MISVIIPTYNRSSSIERSIRSVLDQSYTVIELIVVDDCSTDNTEKLVRSINDNRLVYYKLEKNSGASYARNCGIKKAKGKYIAFQDSDDTWRPNYLETQLNTFLKVEDTYDAQICRFSYLMDNEERISPARKDIKDGISLEKLFLKNVVGTPVLIVKKETLEEIGGFDSNLPAFQDWDLALRLYLNKHKINAIQNVLVDVCVSDDSITRNNTKRINALESLFEKHRTYLTGNHRSHYNFSYAAYSLYRLHQPEKRMKYFFNCFQLCPFNCLNLRLIVHEIVLALKQK